MCAQCFLLCAHLKTFVRAHCRNTIRSRWTNYVNRFLYGPSADACFVVVVVVVVVMTL